MLPSVYHLHEPQPGPLMVLRRDGSCGPAYDHQHQAYGQASAGEIALPDDDPSRTSTTTPTATPAAPSKASGALSKAIFFGAGGAGLYLLLRSHPLAGIGFLAVALFGGGLAEASDR